MSISESLKQKIPDWLKLPWRIALRAYMHLCLQYSFLRYSRPVRKEFLFFRAHSDEIEAQMSLPFTAELLQAVVDTDYLEGGVIECGTYKGGSTILIAHVLNMIKAKKLFYACDTFEGHPYDDIDSADDYHRAGRGSDTSVSYVRAKFQKFGVSDRITIVKGKFEDSFPSELVDKTFSLAFLDCDLYDSAKFCYSFLYPRMVRGGCMVVHDYVEPNKERAFGICLATDEFLHEKGLVIKPSGSSAHVIWIP
jgi:predicted O-methyltransferase YrrM